MKLWTFHLISSFKNKVLASLLFLFFLILSYYLIDHYFVLVFQGSVIDIKGLFFSFIIGYLPQNYPFLFIVFSFSIYLGCIFFRFRFFFLLCLIFFLQLVYLLFLCFSGVDLLLDCGVLKVYRLLSLQEMEFIFLDSIEKYCAQPGLAHYKPFLQSIDFQSSILPVLLQHYDTHVVSTSILRLFASLCPVHVVPSLNLDDESSLLRFPFDVLSSFFMWFFRWVFPPAGHDIPPVIINQVAGALANAPAGDYLDARVGPEGLPTFVYLFNCYYGFYSRYPVTTAFLSFLSIALFNQAFFFLADSIFYFDYATIDFNSFLDRDLIGHASTASSPVLQRLAQADSSFFFPFKVCFDYCRSWIFKLF